MQYEKDICFGCDHWCSNNDEGLRGGCRAFPDGIPTEFIGGKHSHDKIIKSQTGDYVYTPAKREKDIFGRKIEIYQ